jgi:hypothetical protein
MDVQDRSGVGALEIVSASTTFWLALYVQSAGHLTVVG